MKVSNINVDELNEKSKEFINKIESNMFYKSERDSDSMSFDWVGEIEFACPYIDNIVRNPKFTLIKEDDVVKIEKAKKTGVESVKDLSRHTHYIEKIDPVTMEVQPKKILISRYEDTFNTYENRFIYTLIDNMLKFMSKQESILEKFETRNNKTLEYAASTMAGGERISVELKIGSHEIPKGKGAEDFKNEIKNVKKRVQRIKDYITTWRRSEFIEFLDKAHVAFVTGPIKKTNVILKNPNFQNAMRLWGYLQTFDLNNNESVKNSLEATGDNVLKSILNDAFLMDFFVLDSISKSKKEQKEKISKYAIVMIKHQIQRIVSMLLNSGVKITDEEIMQMISSAIKNEKNDILIGQADVKKKFKNEINNYLERIQDFL